MLPYSQRQNMNHLPEQAQLPVMGHIPFQEHTPSAERQTSLLSETSGLRPGSQLLTDRRVLAARSALAARNALAARSAMLQYIQSLLYWYLYNRDQMFFYRDNKMDSPLQAEQLKLFIELVLISKSYPDILHIPELGFYRQYLERISCFPYRPDLFGKCFQEVIVRHDATHPLGGFVKATIKMINLDRANCAKKIKIHKEKGDEIYFHGTDAQSAKCILDGGINLYKSKIRNDFSRGYGFYFTPTFEKAMESANRKSKYFSKCAAAVICFKIRKTLLQKASPLSLEVKTCSGRKYWEKVISHFRNGENDSSIVSQLNAAKVIRGPISKNGFLRPGEIPTPDNFIQICLRDDDLAKEFGDLTNICCVIYSKELPVMCNIEIELI